MLELRKMIETPIGVTDGGAVLVNPDYVMYVAPHSNYLSVSVVLLYDGKNVIVSGAVGDLKAKFKKYKRETM